MRAPLQICTIAVMLAAIVAAPAVGQERQRTRPFRGAQQDESNVPGRRLTFSFDIYEGRGEGAGSRDEDTAVVPSNDPYFTGARVAAAFMRKSRRVTFNAGGSTGLRYYQASRSISDLGQRAGASLEMRFRRSRLLVGESFMQLPFQQLVLLPSPDGADVPLDVSPDSAFTRLTTTSHSTTVGLNRAFGRGGELMLDYGVDFLSSPAAERQTHRGGGAVRLPLGRALRLRLGDHVRWVRPIGDGAIEPLVAHDLDLGVEFARGLRLSDRTTVAFGSGSSIVSTEGGRRYLLTGSASLNHAIARTWALVTSYDRGLTVPDGLAQPVVMDRLTTGVGGMWGRRFTLRGRASAGVGDVGIARDARYKTFTTELRAGMLLTRGWQLYVEHFYFQHESSEGAVLAGLPPSAHRRGLRTGIDIPLEMLQRRRRR